MTDRYPCPSCRDYGSSTSELRPVRIFLYPETVGLLQCQRHWTHVCNIDTVPRDPAQCVPFVLEQPADTRTPAKRVNDAIVSAIESAKSDGDIEELEQVLTASLGFIGLAPQASERIKLLHLAAMESIGGKW